MAIRDIDDLPAPEPVVLTGLVLNPVKSSSVAALGYDPASRRFAVRFTNGREYTYADVDPDTAQQVLAAPSAGLAVNQLLVKGDFVYSITPPKDPDA